MSSGTHRPFAGLTWDQITTLRNVYHRQHFDSFNRRALWALHKKRVPLLKKISDEYTTHYLLTEEGRTVWQKLKEWRPDLFKEAP